jgi:translation initiation factor IF-3
LNQLVDTDLVKNLDVLPDTIRLVNVDGFSEVVSKYIAKDKVSESGLDLLLVNNESSPPVYRIIDYGRFRFEQQKKHRENSKKSRIINKPVKSYQFKPTIGEHDITVKISHINTHLEEGYDVRIELDLKKHLFVLTVRGSVALSIVLNDPNFILNRIITHFSNIIQPTKLLVSGDTVSVLLKKKV